jgi:hypothetical protein
VFHGDRFGGAGYQGLIDNAGFGGLLLLQDRPEPSAKFRRRFSLRFWLLQHPMGSDAEFADTGSPQYPPNAVFSHEAGFKELRERIFCHEAGDPAT